MLTLGLAIITYGAEGIARVGRMLPPETPGVSYTISWQNHTGISLPPSLNDRHDVEVLRFDTPGLSANRNNAIAHCKADIILLADDDITYRPDAFLKLRKIFTTHPEIDVATTICDFGTPRNYPDQVTELSQHLPHGYSVASVEIALRRSTAGNLRCCPEMGLGSNEFHGGEDELLLLSALKKGLKCTFFPITICTHPPQSTGTKAHLSPANLKASGVVIALMYPYSAPVRIILKAWRTTHRRQSSFLRALLYLIEGAMKARALLARNPDTLWTR